MPQVVTLSLAADHLTPVAAYAALRAHSPGESSFLLESVLPGERWGRYSIIGYRPQQDLVLGREAPLVEALSASTQMPRADESLAQSLCRSLIGYLSYDAVHALHDIASWPEEHELGRFLSDQTIVVFDNLLQTLTIAGRTGEDVARCEWEMQNGPRLPPLAPPDRFRLPTGLTVSVSDEEYGEQVLRAKEYIYAGDAFQIVLARTFQAPMGNADPFDVYRALRVLSPSPYLYFFDFAPSRDSGPISIAGASPESMVRFADGAMTLRPIAGTRWRGRTEAEDEALCQELLADPKERAEHVMLIDLARNDIGRVAEPGTVELTANMVVERYSHVMHIVSEVTGRPRGHLGAAEVVRAAFPAGTLTGAPKVRATEIIRELEPHARGIYGGAVGYIGPGRKADLAIAIRTVVARDGKFNVTAGAGLVEGSVPELEAQETLNKARAGLAAIASAQATALKPGGSIRPGTA